MQTRIAKKLNCDLPIFAFSHCRDVVVEVTKAGGFGVLGAATFGPEQLEAELRWIDDHVDGRPYGVDVLIPTNYDSEAEAKTLDVEALIPSEHRAFMDKILAEEGVPELPPDVRAQVHKDIIEGRGQMTPEGARRLIDVTLQHPQVTFVVSALGAPPPDIVTRLKKKNITIGALCGRPIHAVRQKQAGVDVVIAQGTEAGGHTGDISTFVLVPQVVEAVGPHIPVLAAGGITSGQHIASSLALGAEGVWCGSIWLGTMESELNEFERDALFRARTEDAVRRKARTGKTVRMLRSKLSEAWEQPGAPAYLPTPLQGILYNEAHARVVRAKRADLYSFPVGQAVGVMNEPTTVREVMYRLQLEYVEAMQRLTDLAEGS
ncbi:MAG: nitronate monooxygenase [Paracoccaceae bacterium]